MVVNSRYHLRICLMSSSLVFSFLTNWFYSELEVLNLSTNSLSTPPSTSFSYGLFTIPKLFFRTLHLTLTLHVHSEGPRLVSFYFDPSHNPPSSVRWTYDVTLQVRTTFTGRDMDEWNGQETSTFGLGRYHVIWCRWESGRVPEVRTFRRGWERAIDTSGFPLEKKRRQWGRTTPSFPSCSEQRQQQQTKINVSRSVIYSFINSESVGVSIKGRGRRRRRGGGGGGRRGCEEIFTLIRIEWVLDTWDPLFTPILRRNRRVLRGPKFYFGTQGQFGSVS